MIAIDTNLLVYAHRSDTPSHDAALRLLQQLAESSEPWAIPWPCVHEFIAVVTGPAFGKWATPLELALDTLRQILAQPRCPVLAETDGHFDLLGALCQHSLFYTSDASDVLTRVLSISTCITIKYVLT